MDMINGPVAKAPQMLRVPRMTLPVAEASQIELAATAIAKVGEILGCHLVLKDSARHQEHVTGESWYSNAPIRRPDCVSPT